MTDAQSHVVLAGSTLVTFSSDTSAEERDDILDYLNYAEMRAGKKYHRKEDWSKWLNRYEAALYNNGLKLNGVLNSNRVTINSYRELAGVASAVIQTVSRETTHHRALAQLAASAINSMFETKQGQVFFHDRLGTERSESFQVVPCRKNASGEVEIMVCGMQMITQAIEGSWVERANALMTVSVSGGAYLYSKQAYEPYREKVESALARQTQIALQR